MFQFLKESDVPMKLVYSHAQKLRESPARVAAAQALTLDTTKPKLGLKGTHGLYGSSEWWDNVLTGKIPLRSISGIILRAYVAGQDSDASSENNGIDILLEDGSVRSEGVYVNDQADIQLFKPGFRVELAYAMDELKRQPAPDGSVNYLEVPLEMAVSLDPVSVSPK